ncbi:unnamed protein product [Prorocentrum cordatum]|uniref:Secreted protein n=1 Tax=Prorocentrum cordatum TaxID=2364126 RepID=A0ABN9XAS6_9DINO|nr:unnamed protein product [Polarella glacialis]
MSLRMVLLLLFLLLLLLCCCRSCCSHGCPLSIGTRGEEASTSSRGVAIRSSESGHRSLRAGAPKTRRELRSGTPGWTRGPGCSGRCQPPTHRGTQAARAHEGVPMYSASVFLRILVPMSRMITFLSLRLLLLSAASPEIRSLGLWLWIDARLGKLREGHRDRYVLRLSKEPPMATMASHSGRARSKRVRRPGPEQGGTGGNPENAITNLPPGCVRGGER